MSARAEEDRPIAGTPLARLLADQPLSDFEVAVAAGIHPSTLSRYRNGTRPMLTRHAVRLAEALGVSVEAVRGV